MIRRERISEILFGLIMVLTFTGALSVAEADKAEVQTMLIGAIGCNLAWGMIDGLFYLMGSFAEKGHGLKIYRAVRGTHGSERGETNDRGRFAVGDRISHRALRIRINTSEIEAAAGSSSSGAFEQGRLAGSPGRISFWYSSRHSRS